MPIITIYDCPICGGNQLNKVFDTVDYFSSGEVFSIVECNYCGFRFTNNFPSEEIIGKYYDSPEYISHSDSEKGLINRLYHFLRKKMILKKINLVASYAPVNPIRLLDIGCGTGYFLNAAQKRGWIVTGIEKDDKARQSAIIRTGLTINDESSLWEIENASFNVVTLWHVLEHLEKLNDTVSKIKDIITPEGTVVLALPNHKSFDAKFYKKEWAAYDIPRHLWHFSPDTVDKLLAKHQLTVVKKIRMPLDAFYISLLSESYKGSSLVIKFCRAFGIGAIGYLRSLFDLQQSSSIIYIAKKQI